MCAHTHLKPDDQVLDVEPSGASHSIKDEEVNQSKSRFEWNYFSIDVRLNVKSKIVHYLNCGIDHMHSLSLPL